MSFERINKHTVRFGNKLSDPADIAAEDQRAVAARKEQQALLQQPGETDAEYAKRMEKHQQSLMSRDEIQRQALYKADIKHKADAERLLSAEITAIDAKTRFVTVKHDRRESNQPSESGTAIFKQRQFAKVVSAESDGFTVVIERKGRKEQVRLQYMLFADLQAGMKGVVLDCLDTVPLMAGKAVENWLFVLDFE